MSHTYCTTGDIPNNNLLTKFRMEQVSPQKPPLYSKPTMHSMHEIDDTLKDLNNFLHTSTLKYTNDQHNSSFTSSSPYDEFTDLPTHSHKSSHNIPWQSHSSLIPSSSPTPHRESNINFNDTAHGSDTPPPYKDFKNISNINLENSLNHLETISNREHKQHLSHITETQDSAIRIIALKEQEISRLTAVCVILSIKIIFLNT